VHWAVICLRDRGPIKLTLTPVDGRNFTADDSNSPSGVRGAFPDIVVARTELWKNRSEDGPAINPPFQNPDVHSCRRVPPGANLDFATEQLCCGVDDQSPNILANVQHYTFGVDSVIRLLIHIAIALFLAFFSDVCPTLCCLREVSLAHPRYEPE
jgi:hypothetical protein